MRTLPPLLLRAVATDDLSAAAVLIVVLPTRILGDALVERRAARRAAR